MWKLADGLLYLMNLLFLQSTDTPFQILASKNATMKSQLPFNVGALFEPAASNSTNGAVSNPVDFSVTTSTYTSYLVIAILFSYCLESLPGDQLSQIYEAKENC